MGKVIIFIIAFSLIALIVLYKRKGKFIKKEGKRSVDKKITQPQGRRINEHLSHVINKDKNEH